MRNNFTKTFNSILSLDGIGKRLSIPGSRVKGNFHARFWQGDIPDDWGYRPKQTSLRDLELLKSSLIDLGISFDTTLSSIQGHKNQTHPADLIIKQSNNYDIGFVWNESEYQLVTDVQFWQQPWPIDLFLNRITQRYAYNSIIKLSESKGFQTIEETQQENGSVKLILQRWK